MAPGTEAPEGGWVPAHVMAAAPKLYEALKAALPYLENGDSPGGCDGEYVGDCGRCAAIVKARAALAAARGRG